VLRRRGVPRGQGGRAGSGAAQTLSWSGCGAGGGPCPRCATSAHLPCRSTRSRNARSDAYSAATAPGSSSQFISSGCLGPRLAFAERDPLVTPKEFDVLAKRVGNYQYSPAGMGMLIDQLWVR
jgi:hypothetical protein